MAYVVMAAYQSLVLGVPTTSATGDRGEAEESAPARYAKRLSSALSSVTSTLSERAATPAPPAQVEALGWAG